MKIEKVAKMSPMSRFLYWIEERYSIWEKRERGEPKPWTDDEVLQQYFFTNPYRELDKVTVWFRKNVRDPLRDDPNVIFATICFRWFNYIPTGQILIQNGWLENWDGRAVIKKLEPQKKVFTGAFMINSPPGVPKLQAIVRRINNVWKDRVQLINFFNKLASSGGRMETAHERLMEYDGLGGFMAYEVVCDLRYTRFLELAPDKNTWCNPGPGAIRGLYRLAGIDFPKGNNSTSPPRLPDTMDRMRKLLSEVNRRLAHMPKFEMREIEHSLCEFDKYERARTGDGRMKRRYPGEK